MSRLPPPPRVPSDFATLLTYQAPQNRTQQRRQALSMARDAQVDLDGTTMADQL